MLLRSHETTALLTSCNFGEMVRASLSLLLVLGHGFQGFDFAAQCGLARVDAGEIEDVQYPDGRVGPEDVLHVVSFRCVP